MLNTKQRQAFARICQLPGITYDDAMELRAIIDEAEAIVNDRQHQLRIAETVGQIKAVFHTLDGLECPSVELPFKEGRPLMRIQRHELTSSKPLAGEFKSRTIRCRIYHFRGYRYDADHRPIALYLEEAR